MVRNFALDANVKHLVQNYDWYFLPVANPDGYEYTFTAVMRITLPWINALQSSDDKIIVVPIGSRRIKCTYHFY